MVGGQASPGLHEGRWAYTYFHESAARTHERSARRRTESGSRGDGSAAILVVLPSPLRPSFPPSVLPSSCQPAVTGVSTVHVPSRRQTARLEGAAARECRLQTRFAPLSSSSSSCPLLLPAVRPRATCPLLYSSARLYIQRPRSTARFYIRRAPLAAC